MTLADFLAQVADRRMTIVVYASEGAPDVAAHFETRNTRVECDTIARGGPEGFVVVRDEDGFVGAFSLDRLEELLDPPLFRLYHRDDDAEPWRTLYELLADTLFASFDRRQLLAATREIENRAWRVGSGTLRVGFQSTDAFAGQADDYERLAAETDLAIHAYVADDGDAPAPDGIDIHRVPGTELADYWFLTYDASGDPLNACGLVAEERSPEEFFGFWTYDRERVGEISTYLAETYE